MNNDILKIQSRIDDVLSGGANYSDVFIQSGVGHSAHYEDGRIEELSSSTADGCGVRIIVGDKTYYSHTPGAALDNISSAFAMAAESALDKKLPCDHGVKEPLLAVAGRGVQPDIEFLQELDNTIRKSSPFVRQVAFRYSISQRNVMVISPNGRTAEDKRNYCSFAAQVITEKNGVLQTGSERRCKAVLPSDFWAGSSPAEVAMSALDRALLMLDAKPCPAGKMKVLLAGEAGGTIVHEACGHGLEADIVDKDYSVYRDKIGMKVAGEIITMVDDPTIPGLYGSYSFDDEGTPASRNILIENGVLKKYMTDVSSSRMSGLALTGNGRRESYRNIPVPRMSNTFLLPGTSSFDDMLSRAGNGLYVKKMGGGEVNPTSGDFVFYVSEAYLIKDGKICEPVRGATLTGNGPDALSNILELGNNLIMEPGVCGKSGQGVPVTDGQPSMLIDGLTVGGSEA